MANTDNYQEIKDSIAQMSVEQLVEQFNALVGKNYWTSARAAHDTALIDELIKRGINVSAVCDGKTISFKDKIALSKDQNMIVVI